MAGRSRMSFNLRGLDEFRAAMKRGEVARVGILASGENYQRESGGEMSNPEIGLVQEFGNEKIPPRSFLRMPFNLKKAQFFQRVSKSKMIRAALASGDFTLALKLLGAMGQALVQEAFESSGFGTWPPNAPRTIAQKGSDMPLIDTRDLSRSIASDVVKKGGSK